MPPLTPDKVRRVGCLRQPEFGRLHGIVPRGAARCGSTQEVVMIHDTEALPVKPLRDGERQQCIIFWWQELSRGGDAGATTWEVLEPIQDRVTASLYASPPDLRTAESLTALAVALVSGLEEF